MLNIGQSEAETGSPAALYRGLQRSYELDCGYLAPASEGAGFYSRLRPLMSKDRSMEVRWFPVGDEPVPAARPERWPLTNWSGAVYR